MKLFKNLFNNASIIYIFRHVTVLSIVHIKFILTDNSCECSDNEIICPEGWKKYKNHCYFFSTDGKTWHDQQYVTFFYSLFIVTSEVIHNFLFYVLVQFFPRFILSVISCLVNISLVKLLGQG